MRVRIDVLAGAGACVPQEIDCDALSAELAAYFEEAGFGRYEALTVAVSFVTNDGIEALNAQYRGIDEPTDVLSFPLWEEEGQFRPPDGWDELPLGDVIVSPEYVQNHARDRKIDYNAEIILVMIHGILHLVGFDHDIPEREGAMWACQEALVAGYLARSGRTSS